MGSHPNISSTRFPRQGTALGSRVRVILPGDDFSSPRLGTVVRDDMEDPFLTIISLDDGRYILSIECIYQPWGVR